LARRLTALIAYDAKGRELGRQAFHYPTKADIAREKRLEAGARAALRGHHRPPRRGFLPARSRVAPSAPFQRARADGVSVVAGRNGIVLFDLSRVSPRVRALLAPAAGAGCIRFGSFHGLADNDEMLFGGRLRATAAIHIDRGGPFDACEIEGSYGH